jgi:hypothetical protein
LNSNHLHSTSRRRPMKRIINVSSCIVMWMIRVKWMSYCRWREWASFSGSIRWFSQEQVQNSIKTNKYKIKRKLAEVFDDARFEMACFLYEESDHDDFAKGVGCICTIHDLTYMLLTWNVCFMCCHRWEEWHWGGAR